MANEISEGVMGSWVLQKRDAPYNMQHHARYLREDGGEGDLRDAAQFVDRAAAEAAVPAGEKEKWKPEHLPGQPARQESSSPEPLRAMQIPIDDPDGEG